MESKEAPKPQEAHNPLRSPDPDEQKYLSHFLSPILIAAINTNFDPFDYNFGGFNIRVGKETTKELRRIAYHQLELCKDLQKLVNDIKLETNAEFLKFLSTPIVEMKFTTRTYHALKSNDCKTMLDVAKHGRKEVLQFRMIGSLAIEEIRKAFNQAGCNHLFEKDRVR